MRFFKFRTLFRLLGRYLKRVLPAPYSGGQGGISFDVNAVDRDGSGRDFVRSGHGPGAGTVVGMSWMDAVLHTISIHSPSLARPGLFFANPLAASMPRGVAALPSPSRFADTLCAGILACKLLSRLWRRFL